MATPNRHSDLYYGRSPEWWDEATAAAEYALKAIARRRGTTYYEAVNNEIGEDTGHKFHFQDPSERQALGRLLGAISVKSNDERRGIMLTAVVLHKNANDLGQGFYDLAVSLHLLRAKATPDEKEQALTRLMSAAHNYYAVPPTSFR